MQQIASNRKKTLPGLPDPSAIETQLLLILSLRTGPMRTSAIYRNLAEQFGLTRSERYGNPFDPKGSGWEYLVRHAKRHLRDEGWLCCPAPGLSVLTPAGREEALKRQPMRRPANEP
jgi:hypothetical protein